MGTQVFRWDTWVQDKFYEIKSQDSTKAYSSFGRYRTEVNPIPMTIAE